MINEERTACNAEGAVVLSQHISGGVEESHVELQYDGLWFQIIIIIISW
jgi:hypothetical protein